MASRGEVLVTGANGFIASWLVKYLLERGYRVRGTVRDPKDPKNAHLLRLPNAATHLTLVAADLLDAEAIRAAVAGTVGVFHTASPVTFSGTRQAIVDPAVHGTTAVLDAVVASGTVKRVVLTSSVVAVAFDDGSKGERVYDERDWSDAEYLERGSSWYPLSKTLAEREAWEHHKRNEGKYELVTILPSYVAGQRLQSGVNGSSSIVLSFVAGALPAIPASKYSFVDVRDVAEAHLKAYEDTTAEGRYLTTGPNVSGEELATALRRLAPQHSAKIPTKLAPSDPNNQMARFNETDSSRVKGLLGRDLRQLDEILVDSVASLEADGIISA